MNLNAPTMFQSVKLIKSEATNGKNVNARNPRIHGLIKAYPRASRRVTRGRLRAKVDGGTLVMIAIGNYSSGALLESGSSRDDLNRGTVERSSIGFVPSASTSG